MWDYKKVFKSRRTRAKILKALNFVPDKSMLKIQYRMKLGRRLNLCKPLRFTEKIQWYKLYYRNPIMRTCVNKYTVREYIREKGLGDILVPLIAHYKWVEDVEWDKLPGQFVIKTQHGGGGLNVIVVHDKTKTNREEVINKLHYTKEKLGEKSGGREWAYGGMETGIVVEELLINRENPQAGINDYKIFCYNGRAEYIIVDVDRYVGHKRNFYDRNWKNLNIISDCPAVDRSIERPGNLDEMLKIAEKLSEDFPFVRVDLYNVDKKIFFGELTFYPWSGYVEFSPDEADYLLAKEFKLIHYKE